MADDNQAELIAETKHLRLLRRGKWSFVQRRNVSGVVTILALTDDHNVVFVEQYRGPVDCYVIEFPSGLSGDLPGQADEEPETAARRELLEETGYEAETLQQVFSGPTSAGLTDETATIFLAKGLKKVAMGGGADDEQIKTHEVPLDQVEPWLESKRNDGYLVGARVYAGLYFLRRES